MKKTQEVDYGALLELYTVVRSVRNRLEIAVQEGELELEAAEELLANALTFLGPGERNYSSLADINGFNGFNLDDYTSGHRV